jgi:phosphatidylglycerol---prolipoprotein diacylglyceryl transferase
MRRVLFQYGRIKIYSYTAMLYIGVVFGVIGGTYGATVHRLDSGRVYTAMLLLVLPALAGARLLFVASHWNLYRRDLSRIWRRSEGGAALYGGLIAALAVSIPLLRALRLSLWAFWDAASVTMLVGMIFTKVGCLLNGCCAGRPTGGRIALYLPNGRGVWCNRLPAQLMEASLAGLLLFGAVMAWDRLPFDGALFLSASAAYGVGRWGLETTRETVDRVGRLNLNRVISASLAGLSVAGFLLLGFHGLQG